jgi:hypothetical protein
VVEIDTASSITSFLSNVINTPDAQEKASEYNLILNDSEVQQKIKSKDFLIQYITLQ